MRKKIGRVCFRIFSSHFIICDLLVPYRKWIHISELISNSKFDGEGDHLKSGQELFSLHFEILKESETQISQKFFKIHRN